MNKIEKGALVFATLVHSVADLEATMNPNNENEDKAEIATWVLDAVKQRIDREAAQNAAEQENKGKGEKVPADDIHRLVSDLRACVLTDGCGECSRDLGVGCARRLKTDAADMLERLLEEA